MKQVMCVFFQSIILLSMLSACATRKNTTILSVDELLPRATELNQKRVNVRGYVVIDFEDHNLYASQKAFEEMDDNNCVSLDVSNAVYDEWENIDHVFATVSGVVDNNYCGKDTICNFSCNKVGLVDIEIYP